MFGSLSIMAALDYRRRTGKGQYIDHSQVETGLNYVTPLILDYQVNHRELALKGNRSDHTAPHGVYRCKGDDRWVAIAVMNDKEWDSFVKTIGTPPWTKARKYATAAERVKYSDELDNLVESWTINYPPEAVEEAELQTLKAQAGSLERTLQVLQRRIEKLEGEGKAE